MNKKKKKKHNIVEEVGKRRFLFHFVRYKYIVDVERLRAFCSSIKVCYYYLRKYKLYFYSKLISFSFEMITILRFFCMLAD